jgi:hypothetical protein
MAILSDVANPMLVKDLASVVLKVMSKGDGEASHVNKVSLEYVCISIVTGHNKI